MTSPETLLLLAPELWRDAARLKTASLTAEPATRELSAPGADFRLGIRGPALQMLKELLTCRVSLVLLHTTLNARHCMAVLKAMKRSLGELRVPK